MVADAREGPPSALDPHVESTKADFAARSPVSVAQAADRIAQLTGVHRQVYGFRDQEFFKIKIYALHQTTYASTG